MRRRSGETSKAERSADEPLKWMASCRCLLENAMLRQRLDLVVLRLDFVGQKGGPLTWELTLCSSTTDTMACWSHFSMILIFFWIYRRNYWRYGSLPACFHHAGGLHYCKSALSRYWKLTNRSKYLIHPANQVVHRGLFKRLHTSHKIEIEKQPHEDYSVSFYYEWAQLQLHTVYIIFPYQ